MAGTTGANTPAIMMQFNIIFKRHFQDRLVSFNIFQNNRFQPFLFKPECNFIHTCKFRIANLQEITNWGKSEFLSIIKADYSISE